MVSRRGFFGMLAGAAGAIVATVGLWPRQAARKRLAAKPERVLWFSHYPVIATTRTPFVANVRDNHVFFQGRGYLFIEPTEWENPRRFNRAMHRAVQDARNKGQSVHTIVVTPYWYSKMVRASEERARAFGAEPLVKNYTAGYRSEPIIYTNLDTWEKYRELLEKA